MLSAVNVYDAKLMQNGPQGKFLHKYFALRPIFSKFAIALNHHNA